MPSNVTDLSAERWDNDNRPQNFKPVEALQAALRDIEQFDPDHAIIIFGKIEEGDCRRTHYKQAGSYNSYAQLGLLDEAKDAMFGDRG